MHSDCQNPDPGCSKYRMLRNNAVSVYDPLGHAPAKNPAPGVTKFTTPTDPSLIIIPVHSRKEKIPKKQRI